MPGPPSNIKEGIEKSYYLNNEQSETLKIRAQTKNNSSICVYC